MAYYILAYVKSSLDGMRAYLTDIAIIVIANNKHNLFVAMSLQVHL